MSIKSLLRSAGLRLGSTGSTIDVNQAISYPLQNIGDSWGTSGSFIAPSDGVATILVRQAEITGTKGLDIFTESYRYSTVMTNQLNQSWILALSLPCVKKGQTVTINGINVIKGSDGYLLFFPTVGSQS